MNVKLIKTSVREAMSLIPMDMVFYKDKDDKLYRLRYLKSAFEDYLDQLEILHKWACISKYAPDILEGEIIEDTHAEVHVKADCGIYILQKNAEKIKFWDVTEEQLKKHQARLEAEARP